MDCMTSSVGVERTGLQIRVGAEPKRSERKAPNHSIEATAQSPLRALWPAPHVER